MKSFTHLHVHSQFSILDGASGIPELIAKVKQSGMNAIALTDHGNLYGSKYFHEVATAEGVKPIIGCETYVARRTRHDKSTQEDRSGYHLILLAKNKTGYKNLVKLASKASTEGMYYKPRIDKELLEKYHEGLIASSACLGGEIAQKIMFDTEEKVEEAILWHKNIFAEDYYLEIMLHQSGDAKIDKEVYENQKKVNEVIVRLAKKHGIKVIATNDSHFVNAEDAEAHDRLICLNTGKDFDDPNRMRYTKQEYIKTPQEMYELFSHIPEAVSNTQEIVDKVENYELDSKPIMPDFPLPEGFENEDDFLRHISYEGAKKRYKEISDEIRERLDFELETIKRMGFPGYFLIVWDFIRAAREMGVIVGPGRGSAAGSAVAYCIEITNIDPIKYDLLFERFLNPDRISMPDIDIDFDDDGRQQVLDWVVDKYGYEKVSHIVTFGTMAAKMAIRDIARVHKLPLHEADRLAKLVPDGPKVSLKKAFAEVPELSDAKKTGSPIVVNTLKYAETLEGCVRHTGVHACGIIICRDDLTEHIPVFSSKDADLLITQYDGRFVEPVGMLKMDFLGLKTLSIIKETLSNIKKSKNIDIDINAIPLDDAKTFKLYSEGGTTAIFQFESPGMKKHLRALKPNRFEDLVAMNALYRPGPMEYIPSFVKRKHGEEEIIYDHPMMKPYLKDTYGITVYQEQVMLQSRALAGFTRGMSDSLRKAMGKKKIKLMNELKIKFVEGCKNNAEFIKGCEEKKKKPDEIIEKIWNDWEAFAKYAFNKSHSVCYAYVSYQTAYLKAHYPAEFMAAVLSRNLNDIKKITTFMDEAKKMGLDVLGPDINESMTKFAVNKKGAIRFGLAAIKGIGEAAVADLIKERENKGLYKDIFDFVTRVNLRTVNKKSIENLAIAGGFDSFTEIMRENFLVPKENGTSFLEMLIKYGQSIQNEKNSSQQSLFGGSSEVSIPNPTIPQVEEMNSLQKLNLEKDLIGIYLSAHPLDEFKIEMRTFANTPLSAFSDLSKIKGKDIYVGGMVVNAEDRVGKSGKPFGSFTLEDYTGTYKFMLFGKDYARFKEYMQLNTAILVKGKIQARAYREGELEYKIAKIEYLADTRGKMEKLAIKIPIDKISDQLIVEMQEQVLSKNGKCKLQFLVYDPTNLKTWISLFSKSAKININNELIDYLDSNSDIDYRIT
ncbi:MAG: DNA polymerase III subunit alpha [Bacteroidia bacterium]|nr:MAG: DNA polymerase III subunit alpha [Bacteroidia bacterium]